jgi:ATP-dependent Clp protease ATP-binding subunit ClpC
MTTKTGHLNPNLLSAEMARLMTTAAGNMAGYTLVRLTPQLLLRTFLDHPESAAGRILGELIQRRGVDRDALVRSVETMARYAPGREANFRFTDDFGRDIPLAEELLLVIDEALSTAQAREERQVDSSHALAAMADPRVTTMGVLQRVGITQAAIVELLKSNSADSATRLLRDWLTEAREGDPAALYPREGLQREMVSLLGLAGPRHMLLAGPEGSGRRSLARSLALLLAAGNGQGIRSAVEMSESALLDDPLAAVRAGLRRASGGILIVPDFGRFIPSRSAPSPFPAQVNREIQKALISTDQVVIGTVTPPEYERLSQVAVIRQHSHRIAVPPANPAETVAVLGYHRARLEREYGITVEPDALETAARLAGQYLKTSALPGSAVQLADRACALVRMAAEGHLVHETTAADALLSADDVMVAASRMTGIPVTKLGEDEQSKYANMVEHLHERIIGQEEAVMAVSRAVKIARVGLRNPKRPIGSFLFLGPSGVGKSELAKALAEFMFGGENAMLTLDMTEYQDQASVNRLIGAPPGYVGFEGGGQLTDFVRRRPYSVVLLDEIEKAHPRVLDVLLQVLDEGRLTDGQGRLTTFSETVVIMTSNIGSHTLLTPVIGERERKLVLDAVLEFLRPEFLNRIDDVILFHQLTPDQLARILDILLRQELRLAAGQGLTLDVTPEARRWILARNTQPEFGARPLRRLISRHLTEELADFLLRQGSNARGATIRVSADSDTDPKLTFTTTGALPT